MRYWFYLGHPAHFHLLKNVYVNLQQKGHECRFVIKKKEMIVDLLKDHGFNYSYLAAKERKKKNKFALGWTMIRQDMNLLKLCLKEKPDLGIGTSEHFSHIGTLLRFPSINLNEDDADAVPLYAKVAYPLASVILSPVSCRNGKWEYKTIKYESYHELAYLHPNHFTPDNHVIKKYFSPDEKFYLIRFSGLYAHHDVGNAGINLSLAQKIISAIIPYGKVYITSERELEPELEKFRIIINPSDIHHVMAFAQLLVCDSQTMAAESGVLGTPFIRYNSFVDRLGYLKELEEKYQLGYGIKAGDETKLLETLQLILIQPGYKKDNLERRLKMLKDKFDLAKYLTWFIENYPESRRKSENGSQVNPEIFR